ncbi:S-adenosyl-L-methionine-dependent methyltransferase [Methanothermobacter sp. MT-2]|nr:S-adenosyl-L-methionine-dependent methyltransferase [Methanothermobacter sp. MT-2]
MATHKIPHKPSRRKINNQRQKRPRSHDNIQRTQIHEKILKFILWGGAYRRKRKNRKTKKGNKRKRQKDRKAPKETLRIQGKTR